MESFIAATVAALIHKSLCVRLEQTGTESIVGWKTHVKRMAQPQ